MFRLFDSAFQALYGPPKTPPRPAQKSKEEWETLLLETGMSEHELPRSIDVIMEIQESVPYVETKVVTSIRSLSEEEKPSFDGIVTDVVKAAVERVTELEERVRDLTKMLATSIDVTGLVAEVEQRK